MVRNEVQLARLETERKAKELGVGVGALGAAGVLALFGVGVLIATASLVVIGLTAVRVTSSGYHPGTAEQLQLLSPEAGSR